MSRLDAHIPSADSPWDRRSAAHLLRRAGFSPRESELREALRDGLSATVDRLLRDETESERFSELDALGEPLAVRDEIGRLRGWWLLRCVHTTHALRARMALLWHNHFATSNEKVRSPALMLRQLRTIERHALGTLRELLRAIARDPAMIVWLDGNENVKGRPNENFARELFELFTLGVGNYGEADVRDAARAFTGWHQRRGEFHFAVLEHDASDKRVLGAAGALDGENVIDAALATPACAVFIATKLLREFVTPTPDEPLVRELAGVLRGNGYDLAATMRTLLQSRAMFEAGTYRARIKSPAELAVGVARSLELRVPADALARATEQMGQRLFEPPSVKGWDGHRAWLDSATMLVRLNSVGAAAAHESFRPLELCSRYEARDAAARIALLAELTLDGVVPPGIADALRDAGDDDAALRRAARTLMSSPEYQMA